MRRITIFAAALAVSMVGFAPAASAAGQVCYDVNVNVNGNALVQADCVDLPA